MAEFPRMLLIDPRPAEFKGQLTITQDLIDSYEHVNNARYLDIYEAQRALYVQALGMDLEEMYHLGIKAVLRDAQIRYRREVLPDQVVEVRTVATALRQYLVFNQDMYRDGKQVSFLDSTVWILNKGVPIPVPQMIREMITQAKFL